MGTHTRLDAHMRCRGRGGRMGGRRRRRRTAASLAVMGAGTCLFAVAHPKCENNGTQRQTEPLYSETICHGLERARPLVKRNMQESNFICRSPTSAPGPICAGECEGLSLLRFSSRSAVWRTRSVLSPNPKLSCSAHSPTAINLIGWRSTRTCRRLSRRAAR